MRTRTTAPADEQATAGDFPKAIPPDGGCSQGLALAQGQQKSQEKMGMHCFTIQPGEFVIRNRLKIA